jgi:hypothetical protein
MLILYSSYCQLLYTRQPSTWNSEFWINALSKRRCKNPWKDTSTVDAGEQVHDFDNSLCNWVSTHFHQHMQDVSDETVAPVWHLGAIEDIDTDPCSKDESVALLDVVYYDEVHPFKRIHFTKAKDAHHCVERVMDLFVAISSLIVERDHQDSDFRSEISPIPTQFEQILQRLLSLRDLVLQGPHFPDHLNSVTVLISSLSTIRRLKPILASIRHSSRFTFDIFNIMDQFFREVNAIRVIHESFQLCKIPCLVDGSILTMKRLLWIFAISETRPTQEFRDYRRPSPRRCFGINRPTDGSSHGNATAV